MGLGIAVTLIVVSVVLPLMFKDDELVTNESGKVTFAFAEGFKMVMLFCTVICIVLALVFFMIAMCSDQQDKLIIMIVFASMALFGSFLYLVARNKKIVCVGSTLYAYGILGKRREFKIQEIKEAIEIPSNGMKLFFKDGRKVKIDVEMTHYARIKTILEKHNIAYKDKNESVAPKGW